MQFYLILIWGLSSRSSLPQTGGEKPQNTNMVSPCRVITAAWLCAASIGTCMTSTLSVFFADNRCGLHTCLTAVQWKRDDAEELGERFLNPTLGSRKESAQAILTVWPVTIELSKYTQMISTKLIENSKRIIKNYGNFTLHRAYLKIN